MLGDDHDDSNNKAAAATDSRKGASRAGRFPGTGRTLSGDVGGSEPKDDASDAEDYVAEDYVAEDDEDGGSVFEGHSADSDEDDDEDDEYSSDASEERAPRSGLATYNLRTPSAKRKIGSGGEASDSSAVRPSLRTRRKTAVKYTEDAEDSD